jgi:hypothetical protein
MSRVWLTSVLIHAPYVTLCCHSQQHRVGRRGAAVAVHGELVLRQVTTVTCLY